MIGSQAMSQKIQIKGIREGLLVTLGDQPWEEVHQALLEHLDQQADFLRGARLAVDVGNHALKAVDLGQLSKEISDRGLSLWAVISNSPTTERSAQAFGLATRLFNRAPRRRVRRAHRRRFKKRAALSWSSARCALAPACNTPGTS